MIGIVMFFVALFALLLGFPVAFTFGGIALIFGVVYFVRYRYFAHYGGVLGSYGCR